MKLLLALFIVICPTQGVSLHASCSGATSVGACKDGQFVDSMPILRKELEAQNESCTSMKVLLIGSEAGGLQTLQTASGECVSGMKAAVGSGKPLCVDSSAGFVREKLKVEDALLLSLVPKKGVRWCFQAVVSSEPEIIASAISTHMPDAVMLARPASTFLTALKAKPPKKRSLINWLLSFLPYPSITLKLDFKAVEKTVSEYSLVRSVGGVQPMLVITGVEVAKGKGMLPQLRDAFQASIPEVLFVEKGGNGPLLNALHVLYFRKFLVAADIVRELAEHYETVAKHHAQASEREAHTLLTASRRDVLSARVAQHASRLREVQTEEYYNTVLRGAGIAASSLFTFFLLFVSLKIMAPVFRRMHGAVSSIAALGVDEDPPKDKFD